MSPTPRVLRVFSLAALMAAGSVRGAPTLPVTADDFLRERAARVAMASAAAATPRDDLQAALVLLGGAPDGWARLCLLPACGPVVGDRSAARSRLLRAAAAAEHIFHAHDARLSAFERSLDGSPHASALKARVAASREALEVSKRRFDELLSAALVRAGDDDNQLARQLDELLGRDAASIVSELLMEFSAGLGGVESAALSSELSYAEPTVAALPLADGGVVVAYAAERSVFPALEDTTLDREIEPSSELSALATTLGTPAAALAFVRRELRPSWYFGSRQGTTETLRVREANDADSAALLIGLLRAQGVPARYVSGTVEVPLERIAAQTGLLTATEIAAVDAPGPMPAPVQLTSHQRTLSQQALTAAGVPFEPLVRAGVVSAVRLTHVWVEAYLPFDAYRGSAAVGRGGKQWVPIETWFGGRARVVATAASGDALALLNRDADALGAQWLAQATSASPTAFIHDALLATLAGTGGTLADVQYRVGTVDEALQLLPGTLPFVVVSTTAESAFLPNELLQTATLSVSALTGANWEVSLPLHRLVGHRALLAFVPASDVDAEALRLGGGPYGVAANLVRVLPALRIDGREVGRGATPVELGSRLPWRLSLRLPGGTSRSMQNDVFAGNLVALSLSGARNGWTEPATDLPLDTEGPAGRFLYARGAAYANAWGQAEDELARTLQVIPVRSTVNVVFVQNQLEVTQAFGQPSVLEFKGLEMDADFRSIAPLELVPGRARALRRLSGLEGSHQEAAILAAGTGVESVSSTRVLQLAQQRGVPVLAITQANVATLIQQLQVAPAVRQDVLEHVQQGREVLIPEGELQVNAWRGTGYIVRDLNTDEGSYLLSGGLSGGQTTVAPDEWDEALLALLKRPDAPRPTTDTSRIAAIVKSSLGDRQEGVVGRAFERRIGVYVVTSEVVPVKGALVEFSRAPGDPNQPKFSREPAAAATATESLTVETDETGFAAVYMFPDERIRRGAIVWPGSPNDEWVGLNRAQAVVRSGGAAFRLEQPFVCAAHAAAPHQLTVSPPRVVQSPGLELQFPVSVTVQDAFENTISNASVSWSASPPTGRFVAETGARARSLNANDPNQLEQRLSPTDIDGASRTGYIPGPTAGAYTVVASVGALQETTEVVVEGGGPGAYDLRVHYVDPRVGRGLKGFSYEAPFIVEILRDEGAQGSPDWRPQRGDEPGTALATASMRVIVPDGGVLQIDERAPYQSVDVRVDDPLTPYARAFDTDTSTVFWPKYSANDVQSVVFFSSVVRDGVANHVGPVVFHAISGDVRVDLLSETYAGEVHAAACDAVSTRDAAVRLRMANPASWPLFYKLTVQPTVANEDVVGITPDPWAEVAEGDSGLLRLAPNAVTNIRLPVYPETRGGTVKLEIYSADLPFTSTPTRRVLERTIKVMPSLLAASADQAPLRPSIVLPVRNPDSTVTPESDDEFSTPTATEPPMLTHANFQFCVPGPGSVRIEVAEQVVAEGVVTVSPDGEFSIAAVSGRPVPEMVEPRVLQLSIPPQPVATTEAVATFTPAQPGEVSVVRAPVNTVIEDRGVFPVGHVFVKDVSVVDGHVVKQSEDLRVPGRGPALAFSRAYSSRSGGSGPLGAGWSHSLSTYAVESPLGTTMRYLLVGGEGTGQTFTCSSPTQPCRAQRGYHGALTRRLNRPGEPDELEYRSKGGTHYFYERTGAVNPGETRWRVRRIEDPFGHALTLEYGGAETGGLLSRVYQAGKHRFLEFSYGEVLRTDGRSQRADRLRLVSVSLLANPRAPDLLGTEDAPQPLGAPVTFKYDGLARLSSVSRGAKVESYVYAPISPNDVDRPDRADNLIRYTDPDGVVTEYEYYSDQDPLPGEGGFARFEDKRERVKAVVEPGCSDVSALDCRTSFSYALTKTPSVSGTGSVVNTYETSVTGPRPGVPPTVYFQDGYGTTANVKRPLDAVGSFATTVVDWDAVHVVPLSERDARGRMTSTGYDTLGNPLGRVVSTPVLAASGEAPATREVTHPEGGALASVGDVRSWDLAFSRPRCEADAEGRVTRYVLDSNGADPRSSTAVVGTGVVTETRRFAQRLGRSPAACVAPSPRADDEVTTLSYCDVNGTCPSGAARGDLVELRDPNGNRTVLSNFNTYGQPQTETRHDAAGRTLVTTFVTYDERGRRVLTTDSTGRRVAQAWDEFDRQTCVATFNARGGSPGQLTTWSYSAAGRPNTESKHADGDCASPGAALFTRDTSSRDGRGRVTAKLESGVEGAVASEAYGYDPAGNRESVTDGRGVKTTSVFDAADRVVTTRVEGVGAAWSGAAGASRTLATYVYDAVGNKSAETDLHGFRTEYALDSLYRVVETKLAAVPGSALTGGSVQYLTRRGLDLVGNVLVEEDGNGNTTRKTYDSANRVTSVEDAVGRVEEMSYDGNGNVLKLTQRTRPSSGGLVTHRTRDISWDGLNRPLDTTEVFRSGATQLTYTSADRYDDAADTHAHAHRDARGFVTTSLLDESGRAFQVIVDDGESDLLPRTATEPGAGTQLRLTTSFTWDALGKAATTTDARGKVTRTIHDGFGRLKSTQLPMGVNESKTYDAAGLVVAMTDRRGTHWTTAYDLLGREVTSSVVETSSGSGALALRRRTYNDAPVGGLWSVEEQDAANSIVISFMDALGRTVRQRDALGHETETRFDARVQRVQRDARGYVTQTDTDAVYRPTETRQYEPTDGTTPLYTRRTTYDDAARMQADYDWRGTATVLERDGLGRLVKRTRGVAPLLQVDESVFNAGGQETLHTDANGHRVAWQYDGAGRKVLETRGEGTTEAASWARKYDGVGNEVEAKGPRVTGVGFDVRTTYDALNRAVRIEDALGHVRVQAYDGAGNLLCERSPRAWGQELAHGAVVDDAGAMAALACNGAFVTKYAYEELGKLTKVTTALGHETTYVWDATRQRLLAKQDGNGHLTTYEYDGRHQRTKEHQHLDAHARVTGRTTVPGLEAAGSLVAQTGTLTWGTTYDEAGNVRTRTDPLGQVATETHGIRNRLEAVTYAGHRAPRALPSVESEAWEYDGNDNVEAETQRKLTSGGLISETTTRTYDVLDRVEEESRYDGKLTRYGYDAKGNRLRVEDFSGVETTYTYDAQDRLKTVGMPSGTTTYSYFEDGLTRGTAHFNGMHEARCYDAAGRLVGLTTSRTAAADGCAPTEYVSRQQYTYDEEGNRLTQREEVTQAGGVDVGAVETTEYGYDEASRLVGVKYADGKAALYQLDGVGNRVGERKGPSSMVTALTAAAFLTVSPAVLTNDVVAVFNRVDALQTVTDARAPTKDASFTWDEAGNLVRQETAGRSREFAWDVKQTLTEVTDNGVGVGRYDYGADGLRSKRSTALESIEYVLDGAEVLAEAQGTTARRRYHYGTAALAVSDGAGTRALHLDALGSPTTETSSTQGVAAVRQYDAWGVYRNGTAPGWGEAKLGYTGHQYDEETGLVYARARYYDAEYGRFLSRDSYEGTLNSAPSLHRFAYAAGNPLRYVDPDGRCYDFVGGTGFNGQMCVDSAKALGGYAVGVGDVALGAAKSVGDMLFGNLFTNLGNTFKTPDERYAELVARGKAQDELILHPVETAKKYVAGVERMATEGNSFGLGREAGEVATAVVLTVDGAVQLRGAVSAVRARSGVAGVHTKVGRSAPYGDVAASEPVAAPRSAAEVAVRETGSGVQSAFPENSMVMSSPSELMGIEKASPELISRMTNPKHGRTVSIAAEGSEEMRYLDWMQAEANVGGENMTSILLRTQPSKAALLEEFLHGTQFKQGIIERLGRQGAEVQVKDFMVRHKKLLGLGAEDVKILETLREREAEILRMEQQR